MSNAIQKREGLVAKFANRFNIDGDKFLPILKATAFKQGSTEITNEQLAALLVVADQYDLNPFTKEIFAFPDKGGIVPVVSVDGWARIINEHPQNNGFSIEVSDDGSKAVATFHRKDREYPTVVTEYLSECKRNTQPWNSHPKRMLRHKALIQGARMAFGFAGIYDGDEAARIVGSEKDITPKNTTLDALNSNLLAQEQTSETTNIDPTIQAPILVDQKEETIDAETGEIK
jgi:phage recombination protein Bet